VFTAHVTVRNEGAITWTQATNFKLCAVGGSDPFASTSQLLDASDSIATGETKTFTFSMTAPNLRGVCQTDWMMQGGTGWFGEKIDVEVAVDAGSGWNAALDYSGVQPCHNWQYGYRSSSGVFTQFTNFGDHFYMGMSGWFMNGDYSTQCAANQDSTAHEAEFFGSKYYAEPCTSYLAQANSGNRRSTYRWTAPQDGRYNVKANFAGAIYSGGETNCNVYVEVKSSGTATTVFWDWIQGFIGGGGHAGSGAKPSAAYSGTLVLKAGDSIDFFQTDRVTGNDVTAFSGIIVRDEKVDFSDLSVLAANWLRNNCVRPSWCSGSDWDQNTKINFADFALLLSNWSNN
jgi:hypothetical protein